MALAIYIPDLIQRFEKAISVRLTQDSKELEVNKSALSTATVKPASAPAPTEAAKKEEKSPDDISLTDSTAKGELSVGSGVKDITMEGLLQGLRRKKDLHFGNISQPSWKSNKPVVNKVAKIYRLSS